MPPLNSHTHCQAAQASRTIQSLSISVSDPTHGQKRKSTIAQQCISVMRAEWLKLSFIAPNKFCGGRTVNRSEIPHYAYTWPLVCHEVALIQWVRIPPGQLTVHPEAKRTDNPVRGKLKLRSFK